MKNNYKQITLGNDVWSEKFIKIITTQLPHYKTTLMWKKNINIKMEDTPYYKHFYNILQNRGTIWNGIINTKQELIKQYNNFKEMFTIAPNWKEKNYIVYHNNMYFGKNTCYIKNNGDFELYDGRHRISIKLALEMPINLTICKREHKWEKLVKDLEKLYPTKQLYQSIPHPEFNDWKCFRDNTKENILQEIVEKYKIKNVLDCGSCHGYTLYKLRNLIEKGTGVEYNNTRFLITKLLFNKIGFSVHNTNVLNYLLENNIFYDSIFCLAIFHHLMKENSREQFELFLKKIKNNCKILVYSLPQSNETQFNWIYKEIKKDVYNYIQKITGFKNQEIYQLRNRKIIVLK